MFDASTLEVFIASTNDLMEARKAVEEVLRDWNSRNGKDRQIMLKPIRWEEDVTPELGPGSFQAVINERLLDDADIMVGIVGKRLGSPTEKSIAGTVEEIERFAAAKKPVLLYFSDEQFSLSEINTQELERVREFRKSMQQRGLYKTYKTIADLKAQLRSHLDTALQDLKSMLIPAGRALAYGYCANFIERTYDILSPRVVDLPDYKLPAAAGQKETEATLSFDTFRIRIAKPVSLDDATDAAVSELRRRFLEEISVKTRGTRRALRIYIPKDQRQQLERAIREWPERANKDEGETAHLDRLDVIDFPTPMIALKTFVAHIEQSLPKANKESSAGLGYWQRQKLVQYNEFFDSLDYYIDEGGRKGPYIGYFDYRNTPDFVLPA